jgi:hypothetical protein
VRGGKSIALSVLNVGARSGWVGGHHTPAALCPERNLVPIVQKAGWTLGLVCMAWEKYGPHQGVIPDCAVHSELLY